MMTLESGKVYAVECPHAAESAVLAHITSWSPDAPSTVLVVPSESLRRHWLRVIVEAKGAALGIRVMTHNQVVRTIRKEASDQRMSSALWARQLSCTIAKKQPVLERMLGDLKDGMLVAARSIEDLVESGVRTEHAAALTDCIREWPDRPQAALPGGVAPRSFALIQATSEVFAALDEAGFCWPAQAVESTTEHMRSHRVAWLESSRTFVLGYADATCAVADFIDALRRDYGASVLIPCPPNPTNRSLHEPGHAFARSFTDRFEGSWGQAIKAGDEPTIRLRESLDPVAEATEVAAQIGQLVDEGADASSIGVVARNLDTWQLTIRTVFTDHGIPFSTIGATSIGDEQCRCIAAMADSVRLGADAEMGRWLQSMGREDQSDEFLLLDCAGARRVGEAVDRLGAIQDRVGLPYRLGFADEGSSISNRRHRVDDAKVQAIIDKASAWCAAWETWPSEAPMQEHIQLTERLIHQCKAEHLASPIESTLRRLAQHTPPSAVVSRADFVRILAAELQNLSLQGVGGEGGGVQLLDAMEARGRSFKHLFIVGLNRGEFPRIVRDDPILPDSCRREFSRLIPDIREKALAHDEERFLFALLLSSSPNVTMSFSRTDRSHKQLHPSSLLVNMKLHDAVDAIDLDPRAELPAWQGAVWATLENPNALSTQDLVPGYLKATHQSAGRHPAFLGEIGAISHRRDPRRQDLYITTIEAIARCPWRAFLTRDLGVSVRPNPYGPLPYLSTHLIGRVVHDTIDRAVHACRADTPEGGLSKMRWPSWSTIDQWVYESAVKHLRQDGIPWFGFASVCVPVAREIIRELQEVEGNNTGVWGGEVLQSWHSESAGNVHFRIDREDRVGTAEFLTDFKLGKPPTTHRTEETRTKKIMERVRSGVMLQGPIYALSDPNKQGRYIYLSGSNEYPQREFHFSASTPGLRHAVEQLLMEVGQARTAGHMFARVSEANQDKKPLSCEHCTVKEACPVVDSGSRMSIMRRASSRASQDQAWSALWWRGQERQDG